MLLLGHKKSRSVLSGLKCFDCLFYGLCFAGVGWVRGVQPFANLAFGAFPNVHVGPTAGA